MSDPDFTRRLRETFHEEASEHVRALSNDAFELEKATSAAERHALVERVFRTTHTLKGAARMVGEDDAEALCHALEQKLSTVKQSEDGAPASLAGEVHAKIEEIARSLGLRSESGYRAEEPIQPEIAAAAPGETSPASMTASAALSAPVVPAQVKVPAGRLEALLVRAEEMVTAKLSGDAHATALRLAAERGAVWKKNWMRVRSDTAALRRFLDSGEDSPIAKELKSLVHYLDEQHEFTRSWHGEIVKIARAAAADQRRLGTMIDRLLDETKEVLMQPFVSSLEVFPAFVRETAGRLGKEVEIHIEGAETEIDRRVLEELRDALIHLVRNAIDHGIETAEERRRLGKAERGHITLSVKERSGGNVEVVVSDDGHGISPKDVTANARRLGLLKPDAPELPEQEALDLLFASGFSTKAEATDLSGRGLGLAIVREKAERIGGSVELRSEPGKGTTFSFLLPVTLARFRGVFVSVRGQSFVVPSSYVRRVLRVEEADLKQVKNQTLIDVDDESVLLLNLGELLGFPAAKMTKQTGENAVFVLVVETGRSRAALRVDDVPYEHEVVMKSLGKTLRRARHYVGATIVGDGGIVPVLNVGSLLSGATRRQIGRVPAATASAPQGERRRRTILVAEDSITSRSLLKNILQTAGFDVRTAVDGVDALTTLKYERVDLVISDVQMPRMDGFELIMKIRADKALSTLPVILITSLASREDKARGVDAGANAYIVKSSFDQSDLLEAIGRLLP